MRKVEASQFAVLTREFGARRKVTMPRGQTALTQPPGSNMSQPGDSGGGSHSSNVGLTSQAPGGIEEQDITFHCPYPFCRGGAEGFGSLHALVAHVQGSDESTEDGAHECAKRKDGWGGDGWLIST